MSVILCDTYYYIFNVLCVLFLSSFLVTLAQRPGSAATWKDIHSLPSPSPLPQTPTHNHSPPQASTEYPDLVMSSKQLQSPHSVDRINAHTSNSIHNMQDYIFR